MKETCIEANIPWVEDPSNQSMDHKRNVVRFSLDKFNKKYHVEGKEEYEPLTTEGLSRFMSHMEYHKNCVNSEGNLKKKICIYNKELPYLIKLNHFIFFFM